jgi:hypothetical protein
MLEVGARAVITHKKAGGGRGELSLSTWEESFFSRSIRNKAPINRHIPWPQSPNITAKRNGNVITEYTAGLISSYRPTLQQHKFVIITKGSWQKFHNMGFSLIREYKTKMGNFTRRRRTASSTMRRLIFASPLLGEMTCMHALNLTPHADIQFLKWFIS